MASLRARVLAPLILVLLMSSCGGSSDGGSAGEPPPDPAPAPTPGEMPPPPEPPVGECSTEFSGTFDAIQRTVFERHGCAADACHGSTAAGGLDLRPDVAYANLLEVPSTGSASPRITPGDNDRSYLWLKLAAKTIPDEVSVGGSPMPIGATTLTVDELELLREWIKAGAPESGTVDNTQDLVDGCLPPLEPIVIRPLEPPPPEEGLQLVMPEYPLGAGTEREVCFAQYLDFTDIVPAEFQNPEGTRFRVRASDLRQDPQSHHLILYSVATDLEEDLGSFFCLGGDRDGEPCAAKEAGACGEGAACATRPVNAVGCIGVGEGGIGSREQLMVAQQSNEVQVLEEGVYAEIPLKGFFLWNSHAFNLTTSDTMMHARLNYTYATVQRVPVTRIFTGNIFGMNTPPYASETLCRDLVLPQGTHLFNLISHTHKRGKRFWVGMVDGTQIYENFVYNDPTNQYYDPPLVFDSPRRADRTLTYCALYENGVGPDGEPDPSTVKRHSETPGNLLGRCQPTACTAGRVGESCSGANDHAACDTTPGAGDGECDACVLRGGVTTEDEMFLLMGAFYVE